MAESLEPKDKLVLVVDDDRSVLQLFELAVAQEGFRVATAASGSEALERIQSLQPDLMLLDLMLPEYGGLEILEQVGALGLKRVPATVIVTGRFNDPEAREAIRRLPSVIAYLEKPVRPVQLVELLHRALGTRPPAVAGG